MKHPRAKYLGKNGYYGDVKRANEHLIAGKQYTITGCSINQSHSTVTINGRHYNSVLFGISVERLLRYFPGACGYVWTRSKSPCADPS